MLLFFIIEKGDSFVVIYFFANISKFIFEESCLERTSANAEFALRWHTVAAQVKERKKNVNKKIDTPEEAGLHRRCNVLVVPGDVLGDRILAKPENDGHRRRRNDPTRQCRLGPYCQRCLRDVRNTTRLITAIVEYRPFGSAAGADTDGRY